MKTAVLKNLLESRAVGKVDVLKFSRGAVINLQLRAGQRVGRHHTPSDAIIHVVSGRVRFGVGDESVELTKDIVLHMNPREDHELEAIEDTSLLVIKVGEDTSCG
ncbi:cupin domain-containing protein [Aneurinibacillus sp. REN35]|uniref:cupin domain-containing protein n=1 Tax=Aneurinibacillus sp. REN35 TaxID=3237286 RepID=UPI003529182D